MVEYQFLWPLRVTQQPIGMHVDVMRHQVVNGNRQPAFLVAQPQLANDGSQFSRASLQNS